MKLVNSYRFYFLNNWADGGFRYWANYLFKKPFIRDVAIGWTSYSLFGFVIFVIEK